MKSNRGKIFLIIAAVLLSFYFLYPTYQDARISGELKTLAGDDSLNYVETNEARIRDARNNRLKLGLDLQGGMRVVLEVNVLKLLEDLAKNKDDNFKAVMADVTAESRLSDVPIIDIFRAEFEERQLRLSRYYGNIRDSDADILGMLAEEAAKAVDRGMEIVRNRVDQYGVSEPSIQKQGARRIVVELPGISNQGEVEKLLQGTALLEFKLLKDADVMTKVYESIDRIMAGKTPDDTTGADTTAADTAGRKPAADDSAALAAAAADTGLLPLPEDNLKAEEQAKKEHPFFYLARPNQPEGQPWNGELYTTEDDRARVMRILAREDIRKYIPGDISFAWSAKPAFFTAGKNYFALYALKNPAELTGGVIVDAQVNIDPQTSEPLVTMEMNNEGARDWARITGANIKKQIAILMDNAVFSAPVVQVKITGGNSQITGMASIEEAKLLEIVLKAGALPAPVEIIQQTSVGPSLGQDSIRQGVNASVIALLITMAFMIFYYKSGGTLADIALFLNLLFTLAVLAGFKGTLTLPGIAGMILTMATAVDANVLIFERIREESVTGKSLSAAIDTGYKKAFTAIFDSNLTTLITGIILYNFGTGPVKGFALTLIVGILASMFSAIVITRVIADSFTARGKSINFG
ncbi:MAG TPA: protein translocase subunit SecD [Bacteroidota bacterium]|nr:protein translocase subunit SecD [Bacteroidota bacterium]